MTAAVLFDVLIAVCAAGAVAGAAAWRRPAPGLRRAAAAVAGLAFAVALAAWVVRWREAGHWPIFGTWESALSLALAVLAAMLVAAAARRGLEPAVGAPACALAAALLVHGRSYDAAAYALTISERSWVVDVHAFLAWAAFACLATNAGFALGVVLGRGGREKLARGLCRSLHWGFVLHSAMLASGSLYKFLLFGRAWSFDPVETLGLLAWLAYGTLLHMHLLAGWEGGRLATWCLGLFVILVVSYRGIVYFPSWSTYHIFDMDLRMHLT